MDIETQLREAARESGASMKLLADASELCYASVYNFMVHEKTLTLTCAAKLAETLELELRPIPQARKGR